MKHRLILLFLAAIWWPISVQAVEEDRGLRGNYVALASGVAFVHGTYSDGEGTGSGLGSHYELRFGEEVLPGFTLGFCLGGGGSTGNSDRYKGSLGGLSMEAGWQPLSPPLFLLISTGIGGGTLTPTSTDEDAQSVAGAYYRIGAQYDLQWIKSHGGGFILSPFVRGHLVPASGSSEASLTSVVAGVELGWAFGRIKDD